MATLPALPLIAAELNWAGLSLQALMLLVLVGFSAMFSGSETSLFSLTRHQLQQCATSHNPFRRLAARLMRRPKRTLMTILVGNTLVNVLLFASTYVLCRGLHPVLGWWVTPVGALLSVVLVLVGGEVVPKVLAVALADRLAPFSGPAIHFSGYVLDPVGRVIDWVLVEPLTRLLFGRSGHEPVRHDITTDELKTLLELSRHKGVIDADEDLYLREVIDLSGVRVGDIMVPRVEVRAFDVNSPPDELRELMREARLTKVPVYDETIDEIVGLIYAKVLFFERDKPLRDLIMPVHFVPEVINCEQLLRHFQENRSQIAVVVDEYGGMAGLVTLEDVLEEIVGEIYDPEDEREAEEEIVQLSDTEYEVSGRLSVHYWSETFGIARLTNRIATVGGLVTARLGRPPETGDVVRIGNMELRVTALAGRRIGRLRLRLIEPPDGEAAA